MIASKIWSFLSLILHLHITCHPLMLLLQAGFAWNEQAHACTLPHTHAYTRSHPSNYVLRKVPCLTNQTGGQLSFSGDPLVRHHLWRGPPLSLRGMLENRNYIPASLPTSMTNINIQTGCKIIATLEEISGAMQTITEITFLGKIAIHLCLCIFCFVSAN